MSKDQLKQALVSILIGTAIALATAILQALLSYVSSLHINMVGPAAGMVHFHKSWKTKQTV